MSQMGYKRTLASVRSNRLDDIPVLDHLAVFRPPVILGFAPHGWSERILDLKPMGANEDKRPLLAQGGHPNRLRQCPLLGAKRTLVRSESGIPSPTNFPV
jgi:hypothetical protein